MPIQDIPLGPVPCGAPTEDIDPRSARGLQPGATRLSADLVQGGRRRQRTVIAGVLTPARLTWRQLTLSHWWTNKQLLFQMLFGFILVRALMPLVNGFGRLPTAASRTFAAILNAGTRPFHVLNYLSALPGGTVLSSRVMGKLMDSTIEHLRGRLARESDHTLELAMHFPVGRDPYFKDTMTVADVCHYPALRAPPAPAHHSPRSGHLTVCRSSGLSSGLTGAESGRRPCRQRRTAVATRTCID
jgi:hypothetical protein